MKMYIPTGISNYRKLRIEDYYTVDKTLMIQEFLERRSAVTLITRPRRFGKTLNMSMMAEFFDITKESKALFKGLAIMDTDCAKEMNQYPVVFLSFANAKGSKKSAIKFIKQMIASEYQRVKHVFQNLDEYDAPIYARIKQGLDHSDNEDLGDIDNAILFLTKRLEAYYNKKVMLFIDEYDTPFIEAHVQNYYTSVHDGLAALLRSSLKDNEHLQNAMLTGIQRVAKENIFSDLNNLLVCTVVNKEYSQNFGFTKEETQAILTYYGLEYNEEVKQMYDGYRFGDKDIYNPWSIINYAQRRELEPYWINTSGNKMIKTAMEGSDSTFKEGYEELIEKGSYEARINMGTSFYEQADTDSLWGLFVNAGYLTIENKTELDNYLVRIPNNEVRKEFMSLTAHYLKVADATLTNLFLALEQKKEKKFIQTYESILLRMPSYNDLNSENSYQTPWPAVRMMMLGMCAWLQNDYKIISNREEGKGRCDIILNSKKDFLPSYVIEFKYMKKEEFERNPKLLQALAEEAIQQIVENKYDCELSGEIIHIGIAHAGKSIAMEWIEK